MTARAATLVEIAAVRAGCVASAARAEISSTAAATNFEFRCDWPKCVCKLLPESVIAALKTINGVSPPGDPNEGRKSEI